MSAHSFLRTPTALQVVTLLVIGLGCGCKKEEPTPTPTPEVKGGPSKAQSPGETLFAQKGCIRCHAISGAAVAGPPGKRMGPELTKVGADPEHTAEWLAGYIRNPHGQNPGSKMPKHDEAKISEQEMDTLVKYLSSLK